MGEETAQGPVSSAPPCSTVTAMSLSELPPLLPPFPLTRSALGRELEPLLTSGSSHQQLAVTAITTPSSMTAIATPSPGCVLEPLTLSPRHQVNEIRSFPLFFPLFFAPPCCVPHYCVLPTSSVDCPLVCPSPLYQLYTQLFAGRRHLASCLPGPTRVGSLE